MCAYDTLAVNIMESTLFDFFCNPSLFIYWRVVYFNIIIYNNHNKDTPISNHLLSTKYNWNEWAV